MPSMTGCHQNQQPVFMVIIQIQFFPLRRVHGEATGLHSIQRKTAGKVAGNLVGNEVLEWWRAGAIPQEVTVETEWRKPPARAMLQALSLALRSCCCPSPFVLLNGSNKPHPLRRIAARERRHSRITRLVEGPWAGLTSFLSRRQQVQLVLILPIMALAPSYHDGVETSASAPARASVLECGG
jgi:hypothetical protein